MNPVEYSGQGMSVAIWDFRHRPLHSRMGVTPETLSLALADCLAGKELEPLRQQRKPKKEEIIVGVFDAPAGPGRTILIFQFEDGTLWQLCDVGLGWAPYDKVDPDWPVSKKFKDVLPAKINPRPHLPAPYTFEIQVGKAKLRVRRGKQPGELLYELQRLKKP